MNEEAAAYVSTYVADILEKQLAFIGEDFIVAYLPDGTELSYTALIEHIRGQSPEGREFVAAVIGAAIGQIRALSKNYKKEDS